MTEQLLSLRQTTPLGYTSAIHMLDADNGYSGGAGGWIYNTTNGGLNWDFIGSMGNLLDISFPFGTTPANPIGYASGNKWQCMGNYFYSYKI